MTTTVKVLIEGNKACEVVVVGQGNTDKATLVQPGTFTTKLIHGDLAVSVKEVGDFVS